MRRVLGLALATALAVGAILTTATAVQADDTRDGMTLQTEQRGLMGSCGFAGRYRMTGDSLDWAEVWVTVTGPGGYRSREVYYPGWGWNPIWVCERNNVPGVYTVRAAHPSGTVLTDKVLLKGRTQVTKDRDRTRKGWTAKTTVKTADAADGNRKVKLQRKRGSGWKTVATKRTVRNGVAKVTLRGGTGKYRWVAPGTRIASADSSATFRMPR